MASRTTHGTLAVDAAAYKQSVLANRYSSRRHPRGDAAVDLVLDAYAAADKDRSM